MAVCYSCFKEFGDEFDICPHCGEIKDIEPAEPIHLMPGTILANRYIVGKAVGQGGFGIVYKAWDSKLEVIVAIKEFFSSRIVIRYPGETAVRVSKKNEDEFVYRISRFLTEAKYIAKFVSHKNIVNVYDHFEENGTAYIVMELLRGMNLGEYIDKHGGRLEKTTAVTICNSICAALTSLHKENIIHCDIAPDNIFVLENHEIKVYDFGAAKLANSEDVAIDICMKPGYSPPEQYDQTNDLGSWTDIYAVGATLYMMLVGEKPDESTNRKIADSVVPPHDVDNTIPENLSNTVMKSMAVEKHMRFKNADEFLSALNGGKKVYTIAAEKKRRKRRRYSGIATACIVAASALGAVAYSYNQKKTEQLLKPAEISVWYLVADDSGEEAAMKRIEADFEDKFDNVNLELRAIPESEYEREIEKAAENNELPSLFESTGLSLSVLDKANSVKNILKSEQADGCLFLEQYEDYYDDCKQIPLAIEVPIAFVITNGAASLEYSDSTFNDLSDFGAPLWAADMSNEQLLVRNFGNDAVSAAANEDAFMNNEINSVPVMLSTTMRINDVREKLTNYQKSFVYYSNDKVFCDFTYEWSIGQGNDSEIMAAERLLSWMLGNSYQNILMVSVSSDGQIPVNRTCFHEKCSGKSYSTMEDIYEQFTFEKRRK